MVAWQLIINPDISGRKNMEYDLELFRQYEMGAIPSTLRIYSWLPQCISLGYSQNIEKEIDTVKASALGWDLVKRPTGGGIVFHNEAEVTYSLVTAIDNPLLPQGLVPSYKKLSEAIVYALKIVGIEAEIQNPNYKSQNKFPHQNPTCSSGVLAPALRTQCNPTASGGVFWCGNKSQFLNSKSQLCFSYPAEYEIVVNGKKIVGSAQKRGKKALLQQGSIFVRNPGQEVFSLLKQPVKEYNAISVEEVLGKEIGFIELSKAIVNGFEKVLEVTFNDK